MPPDAIAAVTAADASVADASAAPPPLELEQMIFGGSSEIRHSDLQVLHNIGHGSSGVVQKVLHIPSDSVLALKVIPVEADEVKRKQILLELKALHEASHPCIVNYYGAFYREGAVHVALEYMDASLLDISRGANCALPEVVVAALALPVLDGLVYMHREKHIIHRDIKPSNLLVDAGGNVKIADFGVSGELHHTLAKCASWVGTVHYMSPERIQGSAYSYDSDVWSLGITLLELATAAFPYPPERDGRRLSFWDLLDAIVESPPPTPPTHFAPHFHGFISACLQKEPTARASSTQLLAHPLLAQHRGVELAAWLRDMLFRLPSRGMSDEPAGATETLSGCGGCAMSETLGAGAGSFGGACSSDAGRGGSCGAGGSSSYVGSLTGDAHLAATLSGVGSGGPATTHTQHQQAVAMDD